MHMRSMSWQLMTMRSKWGRTSRRLARRICSTIGSSRRWNGSCWRVTRPCIRASLRQAASVVHGRSKVPNPTMCDRTCWVEWWNLMSRLRGTRRTCQAAITWTWASMLKQERKVPLEAAWATVLVYLAIKTPCRSLRQQINMEAADSEAASSHSQATSKTPVFLMVAASRTWIFSSRTIHSCTRWIINSFPQSKVTRACILPLKRIIQPRALPVLWLTLRDIYQQASKLCRRPLPPMVLSHHRRHSMEDSQQANKVQAIPQRSSMESHLPQRPKDTSGRVLPSTSRSRSFRRSSSISSQSVAKAQEAKPLPKLILIRYTAFTLDSRSSRRVWSRSTPCSPGSKNCYNTRSPSSWQL